MPRIQILNCLILIVPPLLWNAIFASKLPEEYSSDENVSPAIVNLESVLRIIAFGFPILLPLQLDGLVRQAGLAIYIAGVIIYFASWTTQIYFQETRWSNSAIGILAPAYTPLIWLIGIALIGHSWVYVLISILFIFVHTWHNVQIFEF